MSKKTKTIIASILVILFCAIIFMWLSPAEKIGNGNSFKYKGINADYEFIVNEEQLRLKVDSSLLNEAFLMAFIKEDCEVCEIYFEHLNHLQSEKEIKVIAILESSENLNYAKENGLDFEVIVKNDDKDLLDYFLSLKTNDELLNPLNEIESKYPYFILFDKKGKAVTDYSGFVPEEMMASDIDNFIKE